MIPIQDHNPFQDKRGKLYIDNGQQQYYHFVDEEKIEGLGTIEHVTPGILLQTTLLSKSIIKKKNYHLRKQQDFLSLDLILDGSMYHSQDGKTLLIEPGEICIMQPGHDHAFMPGPANYYRTISMIIVGPVLNNMLKTSQFHNQRYVKINEPERFVNCYEKIREAFLSNTPDREEVLSNRTYEVLQVVATPEAIRILPKEIEDFLSLLQENPEKNFTSKDISKMLGKSTPTVNKLFRDYFSTTPHRYIVKLRMHEAVKRLLQTNLSIKEIAYSVGYQNPLNFSTEFKKCYKISPLKYKKNFTMSRAIPKHNL
jgi:AraC-like DNA-binding protein